MDDYEFYEDITVSCEKCSNNDKAYLWLNNKERVYLISCDKCGVNEKLAGPVQTAENKQIFCCEGFKNFLNQELHIDENPRVFEVMGKLFYYFENSPNPIVEQIRFCPFCGVKSDIVEIAG